jgi:Ca2+-binding EF-hand superfamily protein
MQRLDIDRDGQISEIEMYKVLSNLGQNQRARSPSSRAIVD